MHGGQLVYNTVDLEGSSDNKGRQWEKNGMGKLQVRDTMQI